MSQIATESAATDRAGSDLDYSLAAMDRCDSCGAQAYVRVTLTTGDLLFCAHHGSKFKAKLLPTALNWHDESSRLLHDVTG